jgi:hypothetical protein
MISRIISVNAKRLDMMTSSNLEFRICPSETDPISYSSSSTAAQLRYTQYYNVLPRLYSSHSYGAMTPLINWLRTPRPFVDVVMCMG